MKKLIDTTDFNNCDVCNDEMCTIETEGDGKKVFNGDSVTCCGCSNTGQITVEAEDCAYIEWDNPNDD